MCAWSVICMVAPCKLFCIHYFCVLPRTYVTLLDHNCSSTFDSLPFEFVLSSDTLTNVLYLDLFYLGVGVTISSICFLFFKLNHNHINVLENQFPSDCGFKSQTCFV